MRRTIMVLTLAALMVVMMSLSAGNAWAFKSPKSQANGANGGGHGGFQSQNPFITQPVSKNGEEVTNCFANSVPNSRGQSNCDHFWDTHERP